MNVIELIQQSLEDATDESECPLQIVANSIASDEIAKGYDPTLYSCSEMLEILMTRMQDELSKARAGYRFPAFTGKEFTTYDQALKIAEEQREAWVACLRWRDEPSDRNLRHNYLIELIDLIHAIETALHHEGVTLDELESLVDEVYYKNKERGYYD